MSESIEGCLTSIGWNRLDCLFRDLMDEETDALRVVILKFDTDKLTKVFEES